MGKQLHTALTTDLRVNTHRVAGVISRSRGVLLVTLGAVALCVILALINNKAADVNSYATGFSGGNPSPASAITGNQIMPANSFYINMGVVPQTLSNGLKPYGLLYDLMTNYQVPIYWAIRPNKPTKDTTDYTLAGTIYRTSIFVVPGTYITPDVQAVIASWQAQGVQGAYLATTPTVYVYETLTGFPKVMIDNLTGNSAIIAGYFTNAGIPATAYRIGTPAQLSPCDDLWANPHADPTWADHSPLYNWMLNNNGNIFSQCHAVSVIENLKNPANPAQTMNYLTTAGVKCFSGGQSNGGAACGVNETHTNTVGPGPYLYRTAIDPVLQFFGIAHTACQNGSEQYFIPLSTSQWRSTSRKVITANVNSATTSQEGVFSVYGPAYGNTSLGYVMYMGGHNFAGSGSAQEQIAAQRAFFNFCLLVGRKKQFNLVSTSINGTYTAGTPANLSINVTGGTPPYQYSWTSTLAGTFSPASTASTTFTPAQMSTNQTGTITVTVTDACNRVITQIINATSIGTTLPVRLLDFEAVRNADRVVLNWSTATEVNNDYFTISRSGDGHLFTPVAVLDGAGNSTQIREYSVADLQAPQSDVYYRLSQTDFDGNTEHFHPIVVKASGPAHSLSVFPNPVSRQANVLVKSHLQGVAYIELWNTNGRRVLSRPVVLNTDAEQILLDEIDQIPAGKYILRLSFEGEYIANTVLLKAF